MRKAVTALLAGAVVALTATNPAWPMSRLAGLDAYRRGDYAAAIRQLPSLAAHGNAEAQATLGFMYENGRGVPQNPAIAGTLYRCAAEQGNAAAQYLLGLMYDKGEGVPRDDVLAQKWLNLAAAHAGRHEREYYVRIRDAVASKMSALQLAHAQRLATSWSPHRTSCDIAGGATSGR